MRWRGVQFLAKEKPKPALFYFLICPCLKLTAHSYRPELLDATGHIALQLQACFALSPVKGN